MNREEILEKSRSENEGRQDERELQLFADASKVGIVAGGAMSVAIVVFLKIIDEPLLGLSALSVYLFMLGCRWLYYSTQVRQKSSLLLAIIGIAFGIACFVGTIILGLRQ